MDNNDFAAFELRGIVLAVFPLDQLARDGRCEPDPGADAVNQTRARAECGSPSESRWRRRKRWTCWPKSCAKPVPALQEPVDAEFFVGRSAYLCDPESNYFEIV